MEDKRWLTIHFLDGTEMRFNFKQQVQDTTNISTAIRKVLNTEHLILEVEGVMYIFPYANVKYIRVSPCPKKLPDTAISGVTLLGG